MSDNNNNNTKYFSKLSLSLRRNKSNSSKKKNNQEIDYDQKQYSDPYNSNNNNNNKIIKNKNIVNNNSNNNNINSGSNGSNKRYSNSNHINGTRKMIYDKQKKMGKERLKKDKYRDNNESKSNNNNNSYQKQKIGSRKSKVSVNSKLFNAEDTQLDIAKKLKLTKLPQYITDEKGYIEFSKGLLIGGRFVILNTLGRGTFSKVFESIDIDEQKRVAIKVIRNTHRYIEAAKTETKVLQHITSMDDGKSACIHLREYFSWNNHPVFVFKLYGPSIYSIMSKNRFRPFPDQITRSLTFQICNAIQFLHHLGIIFTDLKPENMVFIDGRTQSIQIHNKTHYLPINSQIKIVDFGSAVYEPRYDPNNPKTYKFKDGYNYLIQTRHYRAPEVVLEMPWKRPVDIWSVGCVTLEFLYGSMVFNTHCPIDHLNQMQKMIGIIPIDLIMSASQLKYKTLFNKNNKLRLENAKRSRAQAKPLDSYFNLHNNEHKYLYRFVKSCLKWHAKERITADIFFKHQYFQYIKDKIRFIHNFTISSHQNNSNNNNNNNNNNIINNSIRSNKKINSSSNNNNNNNNINTQ